MLYCGLYDNNYIIVHKYLKRGVINLKNEIVIPIKYDHIFQYGSNIFRVKVGKKYGLINDKGEIVVPIIYDSIDRMGYNSGIYRLKLDNKYGLFNINGKGTGPVYDYIVRTGDKLIRVQLDDKWDFLNQHFEEVIPIIYERAWDFEDSFALVKEDGEWYYLFYMSEEEKQERKKEMKKHSWLYKLTNKIFNSFNNYAKIPVKLARKKKEDESRRKKEEELRPYEDNILAKKKLPCQLRVKVAKETYREDVMIRCPEILLFPFLMH